MKRVVIVACLIVLSVAAVRAADVITDDAAAQALFKQAYAIMAEMGLKIDRDILLNFRTRDELNTENAGHGGRTLELNGFYRAYNPESVWVVSGLTKSETIGVMVHELTHAWQSTESPQQDRKLTEGFARWVEYHTYLKIGDADTARTIQEDPDPDYGGGLRYLLDLEKKQGIPAVVQFARTQRDIPSAGS
ncbi:MAG TPA: basic secretory protein-like protein [Candidatus Xenobia bacterium]|jgi:hypothetical protein